MKRLLFDILLPVILAVVLSAAIQRTFAQEQQQISDQQLLDIEHQGESTGCQNYLNSANARAERLRRENERLKKELADLKPTAKTSSLDSKETSSK